MYSTLCMEMWWTEFAMSQCDSYIICKYSEIHHYAVAYNLGFNVSVYIFVFAVLNAAVNDFLEGTIFSFQVICNLSQHSGFFLTAESLI